MNTDKPQVARSAAVQDRSSQIEAPPPPVKIDPCQETRPFSTINACADFLRTCPATPRRQEVLAQMCHFMEQQKGGYEDYKKFVLEFGDGMQYVPSRQRLSLTGPEGLRVHDCLAALKNGEEHGIVLEKVRAKNGTYKDFTLEEIDTLKQMGLSADIIQAMIESTLDAQRAARTRPSYGSGGAYAAAGDAGPGEGSAVYTSGSGEQQPAPVSAQGQYAPSAGQTLTNCAAQIAALEACKHLSGLLQTICNATAKSQFPCQ